MFKDKDDLIIRNAELCEKYELLKLVNTKQAQSQQQTDHVITENNNNNRNRLNSDSNPSANVNNNNNNTNKDKPTASHNNLNPHHNHNQTTPITNNNNNNNITSSTSDDTATKALRDELHEKNKVIKNLQQRLNDMKKTLQKELKYQQLPNEMCHGSNQFTANVDDEMTHATSPLTTTTTMPKSGVNNNNNNKTNKQLLPSDTLMNQSWRQSQSLNGGSINIAKKPSISFAESVLNGTLNSNKRNEDVNNKYLKHVILKFLTSREYEVCG